MSLCPSDRLPKPGRLGDKKTTLENKKKAR